jgi:hypothetical protein
LAFFDAVFNRERVEMEKLFEDELHFFGRGILQVDPKEKICVA